jgi:dihydroorotase
LQLAINNQTINVLFFIATVFFVFTNATKNAVDFVRESSDNIAATITPQHLLNNRNDMLVGGIKPHTYCLPVLKRFKALKQQIELDVQNAKDYLTN